VDVLERGRVEVLIEPIGSHRYGCPGGKLAPQHRLEHPPKGGSRPGAFVLHDAALLVEPGLGDDAEQVAHPVRFHPERHVQRRGRYVLEVIGPVEAGGAVLVRGAHGLERLEELVVKGSEPWNIRCSNRCAKPVRPGRSFFEPT